MPALHDFAMFVAYAKMVIQYCQQLTSAKGRKWCKLLLDVTEMEAEAKLGNQQLPVRNLGEAFAKSLANAQRQSASYAAFAASLSAVATALSSKVNQFYNASSPEYGTLFSSNQEALQNALICT